MLSGLKKIQLISLVVAALMVWQYGGGRTYAALSQVQLQSSLRPAPDSRRANGLAESRFDALLAELKVLIRDDGAKTKAAPEKGFAGIERLNALKDKLATEDEKNQKYFAQLEQTIADKKLPAEIRQRHTDFVRQYQSKHDALMTHLEDLESAHKTATGLWGKLSGQSKSVNWEQVIETATAFLDANTPQPRPRQRFDPNNLPHRSLKADKPIAPKLTRDEWLKAFPKEAAQVGPNPVPPSGPTSGPPSGLRSEAKTGDTLSPLATAPPVPADLAETIEVKFTPEIRQLADSLDRNPVRIYNWVRNNIEFVPIWGSIQGAQLCLETKSCNAFDTASLLISLLRFSGIPSRYQMGTIEVPIEKFKNWAGGFTNAEAAASLFARGGVPSVVRRVNQTGQVITVRLEHVWVKAFVDYAPSGGAVHRQGDTWVEMDASYKQFSFIQSVDYEVVTPSGSQSFVNQLLANATVDPSTGSITNLDSMAVQSFTQQNVSRRSSYLQTNLPNVTVGEAFGGEKIVVQALTVLPSRLPHNVLARGLELAQIPDQLRHRLTIGVGNSPQEIGSANLFNYSASLPELAGKSVLLLYTPASPADHQLLNAALSASSSIPSLLNVVPELFVGNERVATGQPVRTGSFIASQIAFTSPTISTPTIQNSMAAGEAAALGLDLQRVSPVQAQALRQKGEFLTAQVQQRTVGGLTSRDFNEVFLMSHILAWFGMIDLQNDFASRHADVVTLRYPSAGLFFYKFNVASVFGSPTSVSLHGLGMDIDRDIVVSGAKDGDETKAAAVSFAQGVVGSIMEAEVPSSFLSSPGRTVRSISTIHALQMANSQSIPVYRITSANAATIIPLLQISSSDLTDVQDAINTGLEVIVSKTPVSFNGQSVLGMVFKDTQTGSGTFLISGGTNGSSTPLTVPEILLIGLGMGLGAAILLLIGIFAGTGLLAFVLLVAAAGLAFGAFIILIVAAIQGPDSPLFNLPNWPCIVLFLILGVIASILTAGLASAFFGIALGFGGLLIC